MFDEIGKIIKGQEAMAGELFAMRQSESLPRERPSRRREEEAFEASPLPATGENTQ